MANDNRPTTLETTAWAAKILFLAIGIFSTLSILAKLAYSYIHTLLNSSTTTTTSLLLYQFYSSALSGPPYLFLIVNFIIIVIWKLHQYHHHILTTADSKPNSIISFNFSSSELLTNLSSSLPHDEFIQTLTSSQDSSSSSSSDQIKKCIHEFDESMSSAVVEIKKRNINHHHPWPPPSDNNSEKDMDATWTAIMNKNPSPTKKQLINKSDTWEKSPRLARAGAPPPREFVKSGTFSERNQNENEEELKKKKEMRKSKTFRESTSTSVGWRGRDVLVVSNDELFKKVEAFIKMNYDQMKLQGKESQQQRRCVEMMNATAY